MPRRKTIASILLLTLLAAIAFSCDRQAPAAAPAATAASQPSTRPYLEYQARAKSLAESLPKDFTIVIEPPFVVVGNGGPDSVRAAATGTVKWAVDHLKKDYFDKDPPDLIDIYLFKDKTTYEKYAWQLFQDHPTTPFGYYSPAHKVLLMNISTGGGTLVHEIVHPFMAANFPACPTWFNEGLASLYEQSAEKDGHIVGLTNWRLAGLQKAIADKKIPAFKDLFALDAQAFYGEDRGTHYGQSRYLLYYLQQNNLLHDYYKAFVKNQRTDPTGVETLKAILKETDLEAFQERWQKWVMALHYP